MTVEREHLEALYDAINRGDAAAAVANLDENVVWIEPDYYPIGGTHRGPAAVQRHLAEARATWAEGTCEPRDFVVIGSRVVVLAHVHVRLMDSDKWIDGDIGDVYTFQNGKAVEMRHFPDPQEALAWARANQGQ